MRILLVGAAGQLGTDLRPRLSRLGEVVCATRTGEVDGHPCERLDVGDLEAVDALVRLVEADVVVNAAAYTAVDRAESERDLAFRVNAGAPAVMAAACRAVGARFVHFSTDYVFPGDATVPYREDDPTGPRSVYGESKQAGEQGVREAHPEALILRTAWVYALHGHNFLRTMLRLGAEREELRVVADQAGCPTPSWLIADTTLRLLERTGAMGTCHLVAGGQTTWHGFAEAIFDEAVTHGLLARAPRVVPIGTTEFPTPARRPAYSVLDTSRLARDFGIHVPDWRSALERTFADAGTDRAAVL